MVLAVKWAGKMLLISGFAVIYPEVGIAGADLFLNIWPIVFSGKAQTIPENIRLYLVLTAPDISGRLACISF
ncbi:MAG TPA: hypothetical protein VK927_05385 [Adhaeribacter sp.]|nr:hypothetical protein [Adhaeribacter sp.]